MVKMLGLFRFVQIHIIFRPNLLDGLGNFEGNSFDEDNRILILL